MPEWKEKIVELIMKKINNNDKYKILRTNNNMTLRKDILFAIKYNETYDYQYMDFDYIVNKTIETMMLFEDKTNNFKNDVLKWSEL